MRPVPPTPKFKPKRHNKVGLARPMTPAMRNMPAEDLEAIHARNEAMEARFSWHSPEKRRRALVTAVACILTMLLVNVLFTPLGTRALLWQVLVYGMYGVLLFSLQIRPLPAGLLMLFASAILVGLTDARFSFFTWIFATMFWFCAGFAAGIDEESRGTLR